MSSGKPRLEVMLRAALTAGLTHIACVQAETRQGEAFAAPGAASGHSTAMQVAQAYRDQPEPPEALEPACPYEFA